MKWFNKYGNSILVVVALFYYITRREDGSNLQMAADIALLTGLLLIAVNKVWQKMKEKKQNR